MDPIVKKIRNELKSMSDPKVREGALRFFKEEINCYGIMAASVKTVARKYWSETKLLSKKEIFALCDELFRSGMYEEGSIATIWIPKLKNKFEEKDLILFRGWIDKYITNWALCDGFCNHTVGDFMIRFPGKILELKSWARSKNRWMKRAAAVSLIVPARKGEFLQPIFEIADILLEDKDDMVQKGYGWMLKEASRKHQNDVLNYVMRNKMKMPRTALRYAIELMPVEMKAEAMKKDY